MSNEFFDHINAPPTGSHLSSSVVRAEFVKVEAGFDKLPTMSTAANKLVVINAAGNALVTTDAPDINGGTIDGAMIGVSTASTGAFTTITASTAIPQDTNTTQVATTAFVLGQGSTATPHMDGTAAAGTAAKFSKDDHVHPTDTSRAPVASPTFTGVPAAPTAAADTNTTQLATTAYVVAQAGSASPIVNGSATVGTSLRYSRQDHVHPTDTTRAPVASPTFTGTVTLPGDPATALQAATKQYVDAAATGIDSKESCACATTANITLSGLQTIDGYTTLAGNRVLVKDQSTNTQNGIYVAAVGAWARSTDADGAGEIRQGTYTFVNNGTVQAKTGWTQQTSGTITIGSSAITWAQFSSSQSYLAGTGLSLSGNTFNVTTVPVTSGGTGVGTLTGLVYVNGTGNMTAATAAQVGTVVNVTGIVKGAGAAALSAASGTDVTMLIGANPVTNAGNVAIANDTTTNATMYPVWVTASTGNLPIKVTSTKLSFNPSTGMLTATGFTGPLTGNASTATSAGTATHVAGGVAGVVHYQSGVGATGFSAAGTSGQPLLSGGSGVPTWGTLSASYGGTGQAGGYTIGDLLYASSATALSKRAAVATGNALISGGVGVAPSWGKIALTTHVSGLLPVANGGTANAYFTVSGPATSAKTYTFPNATCSVLTTNAAVTVAQGGTGATTLTGLVKGTGTTAMVAAIAGTDYLAPAAIGVTVQAYTASATQAEMEAGTEAALRSMSPLRVAQAISALASSGVKKMEAQTDAGSSTTSTTLTNLSVGVRNYTPVSESSTILVECTFQAYIQNLISTNVQAQFQLYDYTNSVLIDSVFTHGTSSGSGNVGSYGTVTIRVAVPSTGKSARGFTLYGKTGNASASASGTLQKWTFTEY